MFAALSILSAHAERADFVARIDSPSDWLAASERHGRHTVARTETVKFVIDLHDDGRTYFLNSSRWFSHYDFVQRFIDPRVDYSDSSSPSTCAKIVGSFWARSCTMWTVTIGRSNWILRICCRRNGLPGCFATLLNGSRGAQSSVSPRDAPPGRRASSPWVTTLPVLSREAINATVEYQPVVLGVAYGYLRLVRGTLDVSSVRPYDMVVIDNVPIQIPPVAALVPASFRRRWRTWPC